MVKAEVISETSDILAFRETWDRLFLASSNEPSTSFEWTEAMTRHHLEPNDRFSLIGISKGEVVACLVPLVARTEKIFGRPLVTVFPIAEIYNTHSDFLSSDLDETMVEAFLGALFNLDLQWDLFRMTRLLKEHPLLRFIENSLSRRPDLYRVRYEMAAFFLPLNYSFDEYLANRSAKFRNHLKRTEKKIESAGKAQVIKFSNTCNFEQAYEDLLQIERNSWKHLHGTAISAIRRQTGFYRDMCRSALKAGRMQLQFLHLDGVPIAYNIGYIRDTCYYYLKTSFDERFKQLGPSTFLRARLIEELIGCGTRRFDFPGEPYEWERQWTKTLRWHKSILIYNDTFRGRMFARLNRIRQMKDSPASQPRLDYHDARALKPPKR